WRACRTQSRPRLDDLAQRIEPVAGWDDIVLPRAQLEILREVAAHVRGRQRVYDDWGFARKSLRGLGVSALFEGVSGTGKTMAAGLPRPDADRGDRPQAAGGAQPGRREHPQHRSLRGVPRCGRAGAGRDAPSGTRGSARVHEARAAALGGGGAGVDLRVVLEEL